MIINFLNEEITIEKINKEYQKNYSDIPEEDFMTMVKMDPSSYPQVTKGVYNTDAEPFTVGSLASGGGGGLLIRCYRKGEKDFLKEFDRVKNACAKFLANRGSYSIKNAGAFDSVAKFLEYVEADGNVEGAGIQNVEKEKKVLTPKEKLDVLRQKQFPQIETVDELIEVANLDEDSDTEHGQIGNIARNFLLPHYAKGERDFLSKKISTRKAVTKYYNEDKPKPLKEYETVKQFVLDLLPTAVGKNNLMALLKLLCVEDADLYDDNARGYKVVCQNQNFDVIQYGNTSVGTIINRCDYPINKVIEQFNIDENSSVDKKLQAIRWLRENANGDKERTNRWCTGNTSWAARSYSIESDSILIAFIKRDRPLFEAGNKANFQISAYNNGTWHDIELGNNTGGISNWKLLSENVFPENLDILPYLLDYPAYRANNDFMALVNKYHITQSKQFDSNNLSYGWDDDIEQEPEPLHYSSTADLENYNLEKGDPKFNNVYEIIIEEGVEKIPNFEFQNFRNLTKIQFPNSLKEIGAKAFAGCISLSKLNLPSSLEVIGLGAFEGCMSLRGSIRLPINIRRIERNAFKFHSKKGISFVISPRRLDADNYIPLDIAEEDHDFWFKKDRIKFSDN